MELKDKLVKSTIDILLQTPFLAKALYLLPMKVDTSIPTCSTDGKQIYYSPEFLDTLSTDEISAVRVHEIMHVLLGHHIRIHNRKHMRWNIAADYAVNLLVRQAGYTLPKGVLLDNQYAKFSTEHIYDLLPESIESQGSSYGEVTKAENSAEAEAEWKALVQSTRWGNLPDALNRALKDQVTPKLSLFDLIIPYLNSYFPEDYTFLRSSKRNNSDFIFPALSNQVYGHLVICVDTSGSISLDYLQEFWSLIRAIPTIAEIDLVSADAEIKNIKEGIQDIPSLDIAMKNTKGGGGTDFRPALAWANEQNPDLILYLTDGFGTFGDPVDKTLWAILGSNETELVTPPWGDYVKVLL